MRCAAGTRRTLPFAGVWRGLGRLRARRALRALRAAADTDLARRDRPPLRLAWRVEELVGTKNRLDLAHSVRSLVRDARPSYLPSASPFNRLVVRAESDAAARGGGPARRSRAARRRAGRRPAGATADRRIRAALRPRPRRRVRLDPRHDPRRAGATLMVELLGIVIAVLCFAIAFALIVLLERV